MAAQRLPLSAEMIARLGWDCLVADMQHSMTSFSEMLHLLQVTTNLGATVLVRSPALDVALIGRLLDAGASGIICPMVNTPAEAEALVSARRRVRQAMHDLGYRLFITGSDLRMMTAASAQRFDTDQESNSR